MNDCRRINEPVNARMLMNLIDKKIKNMGTIKSVSYDELTGCLVFTLSDNSTHSVKIGNMDKNGVSLETVKELIKQVTDRYDIKFEEIQERIDKIEKSCIRTNVRLRVVN